MSKNFVKTDVKVLLDGKEVTNFSVQDALVISADEAQNGEVLKLFEPFSGTITLTDKQAKRLLKVLKRRNV